MSATTLSPLSAVERDALSALYTSYRGAVRRYLFRLRKDTNLVDDLTQETFLYHLRTVGDWKGENSLESRLIGIARTLFLMYLRSEKVRSTVPITTYDVPAPADESYDDETLGALRTALSALLTSVRAQGELLRATALQRILGDGERSDAVARDLGCPIPTVKAWKQKAVARLRLSLSA